MTESLHHYYIKFIFQQDGAPAHRASETVQLLKQMTPDFITPNLWPPNSPDLNPVDCAVWTVEDYAGASVREEDQGCW